MQVLPNQYAPGAVRDVVKVFETMQQLDSSQIEVLKAFKRQTKSLSVSSIEHSDGEKELVCLRVRVKEILKSNQAQVANTMSGLVPVELFEPHRRPQLKAHQSHSSPLIRTLRSSQHDLQELGRPKIKNSSEPILHNGATCDVVDVIPLLKEPSKFMQKPLVFAKVIALYTVLDERMFRWYQEDASQFAKGLREGAFLTEEELELLKEAKKIHGRTSKTARLFSKRSSSDQEPGSKSVLKVLAPDIKLKVVQYICAKSLESSDFLVEFFTGFGKDMGIEAEDFLGELLKTERIKALFITENRAFGDAVMHLLQLCFAVPEYYPKTEGVSVWFTLFLHYLQTYKAIPCFFCRGGACIKFSSLLDKARMDTIVANVGAYGLSKELCSIVYNRFEQEHDAGLALKLLTSSTYTSVAALAQAGDEVRYFSALLMIKTKVVDFALLAKPEFRTFILQNNELCDQLIERVHAFFQYENLPEGYSDVRQTQAGPALLEQNRKHVNKQHEFTFLSQSEITHMFMTLKPINRLKQGELWLEIYKKNLQLVLKHFSPHLRLHLAELSQVYKEYRACTIGVTASTESSRYDPTRHALKLFPACVVQYIQKNPDDLKQYEKNLEAMGEIYNKMGQFDTVRMNEKEVLGFISVERMAEEILKRVPTSSHKFTQYSLSVLLSKHIVKIYEKQYQGSKRPSVLYTDKTVTCVRDNGQLLWFKSYALAAFVECIDGVVKMGSEFTEDQLQMIVADFCKKNPFNDSIK